MYPIYILEDDVIQQNRLKEAINRYAVSQQWGDYQCEVFDDGQELLTAFEKSEEKALFFLDLEIKGVKRLGLEVAKVIYKTSPFSLIVFVSTHSEYMPYTYKSMVRAMDFIIKDESEEEYNDRVASCLDYVSELDKQDVEKETFLFRNSEGSDIFLKFDEIFFVETDPQHSHKLILYSFHSRIEFRATLSEVLKSEPRFFKCHRSFLINPKNVTLINRRAKLVYFRDGLSCPISRRNIKTLIKLMGEGGGLHVI
ncbi:MAG: response regulator transcription factor [Streptococcus hyointestinalis]|nr:response regulator transcription factor [Streptococcus hyointestinalis]MDD6385095.1 response regulator transcription factor [Streptococcus hyointestinalis]